MADTENGQERTEQATAKRLEEARRQGQVPRSADLNSAAVVLLTAIGIQFFGPRLLVDLLALMRADLAVRRGDALDEAHVLAVFGHSGYEALLATAPLLGLAFVAALLAPMTLSGWTVSLGALAPDFTRLSPLSGLQRMFSARSAVELGKAFLKFAVVAIVAITFLRHHASSLLLLGAEPITVAFAHVGRTCVQALVLLAGTLALFALIDVPWQLWQYAQRLRMSRQEIREEHKEHEGSPEIRSRIRRAQQDVARRRMMQDIPQAQVVVVNPTHFAVALRYDEARMRAPVVVAKGVDEVAARIRSVAMEHRVPIFEAPPLARALFRNVDIGAEIPASLYLAVAQVLTYVFQLGLLRAGAPVPLPPRIELDNPSPRH